MQDALLFRHCQGIGHGIACSLTAALGMRRALRPLGAYHELPLCVVPAPAPGQAAQEADGGSNGGGWAVNTDMGFVSAPVTATAAEVHEYVEARPHQSLLFLMLACEVLVAGWSSRARTADPHKEWGRFIEHVGCSATIKIVCMQETGDCVPQLQACRLIAWMRW